MKLPNRVFLSLWRALGDNLALSGLVRYYAEHCVELYLPVAPQFYNTLCNLYVGTNIIVIDDSTFVQGHVLGSPFGDAPFRLAEDVYCQQHGLAKIELPYSDLVSVCVQINEQHAGPTPILWEEQAYTMMDVPYSVRYSHFKLPKNREQAERLYDSMNIREPYALLHQTVAWPPNRLNLEIRHLLGGMRLIEIMPDTAPSMLDYVILIERATHIHCVPTSFFVLVDNMAADLNATLFFHSIRRHAMRINHRWNKRKWNHIYYDLQVV